MRRKTPVARIWTTSALVILGAGGYLLTSGALDPVLTDAITLAQGNDATGPVAADSPRVSRVADWQYFDNRPEWSSVRGVPQVAGPSDPVAPSRPLVAPPENPIHFIFGDQTAMPHYGLKPMSSCPQQRGPGSYVEHFVVTAGKGQVTATWWDLGDPDTTEYQLVAVPDYVNVGVGNPVITPPPQISVKVPAPKACRQVTAVLPGLTTGHTYLLMLEAINFSPVQQRAYEITRAQVATGPIP